MKLQKNFSRHSGERSDSRIWILDAPTFALTGYGGLTRMTIVMLVVLVCLIVGIVILSVTKNPLSLGLHIGQGILHSVQDDGVQKSESAFKKLSEPKYYPPVKMEFGNKSLDVEPIDVEEGGTLGVPGSWYTAGWYSGGAKIGEKGNVIIDGHYDTNTGAPGAFWGLKNLQIGDKVFVLDEIGRTFKYSINGKSFVSIDDPERAKVFENGEEKLLTLITCGGIWNPATGMYDKRLVVTAVRSPF